jgi:hypothetical protein
MSAWDHAYISVYVNTPLILVGGLILKIRRACSRGGDIGFDGLDLFAWGVYDGRVVVVGGTSLALSDKFNNNSMTVALGQPMQTRYEIELQTLKPWDEVQYTCKFPHDAGYEFIHTAGHGYLVVPMQDTYALVAKSICKYGFIGEHAYYLEEDSEAGEFIRHIR